MSAVRCLAVLLPLMSLGVDGAQRSGALTVIRQRDRNTPVDPASYSVSASGRFVAFTSPARLIASDTNNSTDLYVVDLETGDTTLESSTPGWASRFRQILFPRISGDGRFVAFQAHAREDDSPFWFRWHVAVLDRATRVVKVLETGLPRNTSSEAAAMSADGTTVVFESRPLGEVGPGPASGADIHLLRLNTNTLARVNVASDGTPALAGISVTPAVSADGRHVAFMSTADLTCSGNALCPAEPGDRNAVADIYLRDTLANTTSRISRGVNGKDPNGPSSWPAISGDGRYIVFVSEASNLVRGDRNGQTDIFLYDTRAGTTELVSRRADGKVPNGPSRGPAISADGMTIAFQSLASDLTCAKRCRPEVRDINMLWDVFVVDRGFGATVRASADATTEWMEASFGPALDATGRVLVFASKHPMGPDDLRNDNDLFVWRVPPGPHHHCLKFSSIQMPPLGCTTGNAIRPAPTPSSRPLTFWGICSPGPLKCVNRMGLPTGTPALGSTATTHTFASPPSSDRK